MITPAEVLTVGEPLVALVGEERAPLTETRMFSSHVTGAEVNFAIGMARLGHRVAVVGRVGDDEFGQQVRKKLRAESVDDNLLFADPRPTGLLFRSRTGAVPEVLYRRADAAGSQLSTADLARVAPEIRQASWLHLTGITPALSVSAQAAVEAAIASAQDAGVRIGLDINYRARLWSTDEASSVLRPLIGCAEVVFATLAEARLFGHAPHAPAAVELLLDLGARTAVVREGTDTMCAREQLGDRVDCAPTLRPQVVDSVGAGDGFAAGFTSYWLREQNMHEALRAGSTCGGMAVGSVGDTTGLPTSAALAQILQGSVDDVIR